MERKESTEKHEEAVKAIEVIVSAPVAEKQPEEEDIGISRQRQASLDAWQPKTELGRKVKSGEIKDINLILNAGIRILEPEIVDMLLPSLQSDLVKIGQSKGKFGGGKRSIWRQTQKKTKEGNKPKFSALAIVGNKNGIVGVGYGKAKETVPAREKALRNAKLNIIMIARGCGSWECSCRQPHSIPYKLSGKNGSVIINLVPAPKGTGLKVEKECQRLLDLTGIKDVYSKSFGQKRVKMNMIKSCFKALKSSTSTKIPEGYDKLSGLCEGPLSK